MVILTKYNNGDKVYAVDHYNGKYEVHGPLTVGRISVEITDSPGREGEELFDNYKARKERKESYMMVETGIGTGRVWQDCVLFRTAEEAYLFSQFCQEEAKCRR